MSPNALDRLRSQMTDDLCTRCGTCVGLGRLRIVFGEREGAHLPQMGAGLSEAEAERILAGCSAQQVSFPDLNAFVFGKEVPRDPFLGTAPYLAIGYSFNEANRWQGSSGGVLTEILLWLLETGKIQGAVVTRMSLEKPWQPETFIATTAKEIIDAAQSKYVITSVNEILPEIERFPGTLAYVGLPCQVQALRKLQQAGDPAVRPVRYVLGPFCGNTLEFTSIRTLLRSHGERDFREIAALRFREGEWPGNLHLRLRSGRVIALPKFHANYLIPFHIMKRCLLCTDLTNEFTDISGGDAWAPVYEERGKGFSAVVGRSKTGVGILQEMQAAGRLNLTELSAAEAVRMHTHGYDLKKRGAFIRMTFRRWLGRPTPEYGYRLGGFPVTRYAMEVIVSGLFAVLGTRPARWALGRISPKLLGRAFVHLRTLWKKMTRGIKTHELQR